MLNVLICIIIADFLTGFIHWIEDTYGVKTWPWPLKDGVVLPNIEHHRNPTFIATMSSFISRNAYLVVPAVVVSLVALVFGYWQVALIFFLMSWGNETHTWSHKRKNNRLIAFLQDAAIVQTAGQHAKHHKKPYDKYYCTLTNFTNAVLEVIHFWRGLEWILKKMFGLEVKRMTSERDGF